MDLTKYKNRASKLDIKININAKPAIESPSDIPDSPNIPDSSSNTTPSVPTRIIPSVIPSIIPKVKVSTVSHQVIPTAIKDSLPDWAHIRDSKGNPITLDADQRKAVKLAIEGKSFAMIGKAGTGKTTTVQAMILAILEYHSDKIFKTTYRIRGEGEFVEQISIGVVAFANRAANNIRQKSQAHPDLKDVMDYNVTTLHNMLCYTVEFYDDPETGKTKRRYYPGKGAYDKLELTHLFVEEASMVAVGDSSIWQEMFDALPTGCQVIFLGDPNQVPPVGGKPVLAYAMQKLEVVELTHVHRQALDNPIIRQALNCLEGKDVIQDYNTESKLGVRVLDPALVLKQSSNIKIVPYKYRIAAESLINNMMKLDQFDPLQDIILCPNNKHEDHLVSTAEFNAQIAWTLAKKYSRKVYEIKAGFRNIYLAVGDKVMIDKYDGIVTNISLNGKYIGPLARPASTEMDYKGNIHSSTGDDDVDLSSVSMTTYTALDLDALVDKNNEDDEKTRAASHLVDVELENGQVVTLSSAGNFGESVFSLGYAISVHKAQGSEWRNVIVALHDSARMLLFRELLYTAMTRAIERLDIIVQPHTLAKTIANPRIKGNSLADKIEFFNSGYLDQDVQLVPNLTESEDE